MKKSSCSITTPVGCLSIDATEAGVVSLAFDDSLADAHVHNGGLACCAGQEIMEYFQGKRAVFTVPVSLSGLKPFTAGVLEAARNIPLGKTLTYGELAANITVPGAARAVGQALARNPVPIIIPCHRVIPASGNPGGYTWRERGSARSGTAIKTRLLELERIIVNGLP